MFINFKKIFALSLILGLALTVNAGETGIIEDNGTALRYQYDKPFSTPANNLMALYFLIRPDIWSKLQEQEFIRKHKSKPLVASDEFAAKYDLVKRPAANDEMMTITKKQRSNNRHVIILHGGVFVYAKRGLKYFEEDIELIMNHLGDRATYVDYPSTQTANYKEITATAIDAYKKLLQAYPNDEFVVFGNSAGANLALAMAQQLRDEGIIAPPQTYVLLSPWADLSTDSREMARYNFYDVILNQAGLKYGADLYRGNLPYKHPKISPLYGDFRGLGKIAIFQGSYDILYPSGLAMYKKAKAAGLKVHHYQYNRFWHDWMLYNKIPEAYTAWKQAAEFVK